MPVLRKKAGVLAGLATLAAAASMLALAAPASADTAARSGDAVFVGSDTVQNIVDFVLDGAPGVAGGYNNGGNNHRALNIFATGDANGRLPYDGTCGAADSTGIGQFCDATTTQAPNALKGTVVIRNGTSPVTRPNGSGDGLTALTQDASAGYQTLPAGSLQFARASRLPKSGEESACDAIASCGGLHTYRIATDNLAIATVASGYHGATTLTATDLKNIYNCTYTKWSDVPSYSGSFGAEAIHPLIPQSGSGTRNFFLSDIGLANPSSCVRVVEEHDPTGIYADSAPADAIEPFSTGKLHLINSGYFGNPGYTGTGAANGAYTAGYLTTLGGSSYNSSRGLYVVVRQADLASTTPFQPGGTQNVWQALISTSGSFFAKSLNSGQYAYAGVTQAWKDCGLDVSENGNPQGC